MKKMIMKLAAVIPALAFVAGIVSLNSACILTYHQPEIPSSLDNYRK